jgi:hypothetical protein
VKFREIGRLRNNFPQKPAPSGKKINPGCIRCAGMPSELETDDYHRAEVLIMVEDTLARTRYA